ncbi:MAG: hypothetical protein ABI444_02250 [Candidatus Kapaibacterium sp.]|jgi:hypothetical protein
MENIQMLTNTRLFKRALGAGLLVAGTVGMMASTTMAQTTAPAANVHVPAKGFYAAGVQKRAAANVYYKSGGLLYTVDPFTHPGVKPVEEQKFTPTNTQVDNKVAKQ